MPIREHISKAKCFTHWLDNEAIDCGICDPPLDAQKALDFLKDYLLGEDWCVTNPENVQQVNSAIVYDILKKYSPKFRKEYRIYRRAIK